MAGKQLSKVMKYELRYVEGCGGFYEMQHAVWNVISQTQELLNKTIQAYFQWDCRCRDHLRLTGEKLDEKKELGCTLDNYIYHHLRDEYADLSSAMVNAVVRKAAQRYKASRFNIEKGKESVPSYKRDQPVLLHNKDGIRLTGDVHNAEVLLTMFSREYQKRTNLDSRVRFKVMVCDRTQESILSKVLDGQYGLGQCQLVYDKRKWFLLLTYQFTPEERKLDPEKILGVDLGEAYAIYASSVGEYERLRIEGGEVTEFAQRCEARRKSLQHQAAYCGEGRIGHGTKTRVDAVYSMQDRIANFRKTINHRYSKALVDFAVKNGYGTIQMEDLSGIKSNLEYPRRLQHWTYYDLQSKIEAKAAEAGIVVRKVKPRYTSQRCSRCGNIDPENRKEQATFCCTQCGYRTNADYNASQNLSIKGIDEIIAKELSAKDKQSEKE